MRKTREIFKKMCYKDGRVIRLNVLEIKKSRFNLKAKETWHLSRTVLCSLGRGDTRLLLWRNSRREMTIVISSSLQGDCDCKDFQRKKSRERERSHKNRTEESVQTLSFMLSCLVSLAFLSLCLSCVKKHMSSLKVKSFSRILLHVILFCSLSVKRSTGFMEDSFTDSLWDWKSVTLLRRRDQSCIESRESSRLFSRTEGTTAWQTPLLRRRLRDVRFEERLFHKPFVFASLAPFEWQ